MPIEHKNITGTDLHEPKDVASATTNQAYLADGAGSGGWVHPNPHGGCYHSNMSGTANTPAAANTWEVLGVTTTVTHVHEFTHTTPHKLVYTGTPNRHLHMVFNMSFEATSTAGTARFGIYKNGVLISESQSKRYFANGNPGIVAIHWDDVASTNDYYEVYWQHEGTARACTIYSTYFFMMGMPD